MTRAVLLLGLPALLLSLSGCNCGPAGQNTTTTCTYGVDPPKCYSCPSASAAATCATSGPAAGGCTTTPITCP